MCQNNKCGIVSKSRYILRILNCKYEYSQKKTLKADRSIESRNGRLLSEQVKKTRCVHKSNCPNQKGEKGFHKFKDYLDRKEDICQSKDEKIDNEFDNGSKNLDGKEIRNMARDKGYIAELSNKNNMELSNLDDQEILGLYRRFKFTEQGEYLEDICRYVAVKGARKSDISHEIEDMKYFDYIPPVNLLQHYKKESGQYYSNLNAHVRDNCMAVGNICRFYNRHENVGLIDSISESECNSAPEYTKKLNSLRDNAKRLNKSINSGCTRYPNEFYGTKRGSKQMVSPRLSLADKHHGLIKNVNPKSQKTPHFLKQFGVKNHSESIVRIEKLDTKESFGNNMMNYYQNLRSKNMERLPENQHTILKAKTQYQSIYSTDFYQIDKKRWTPIDSIHTIRDYDDLAAVPRRLILGQTSLATCEAEDSARHPLDAKSDDCIDKYVSMYPDLHHKGIFSGRDLWGEDVENAFLEAITLYPLDGNKRIKKDKASPSRGRNYLISEHIYERTGKRRTNKQISSHIQVLKQRRCGMECKFFPGNFKTI
ncbi:MAG: hypothetical protein MHMPM18_000086 [Marteilia pararefringens]